MPSRVRQAIHRGERASGPVFALPVLIILLSACGAKPPASGTGAVPTGTVFSVSCERGWADCYAEARRRCAGGDFEEIDRNALERATLNRPTNRSAQVRVESTYLSATFRCR